MEPIRSTGVEKYLSIIGGYDNEFANVFDPALIDRIAQGI